jgi:hypothetical protein
MMKILPMIVWITCIYSVAALANDSAVETAVGGLKLRKENSVLMEKERLFISETLVRVEYEFRNTTKDPIVSEVAFPIPTFEYSYIDAGGRRDFADFKAWIDGKPIKIEKEVRAFVNENEVTEDLQRADIKIETFGDFDPHYDNQIMSLKGEIRDRLVKIRALEAPDGAHKYGVFWPLWTTKIQYHWRQIFPPGAVVRIKHEYRPVIGFRPVQLQKYKDEFKDSCIDNKTFEEVTQRVDNKMQQNPLGYNYFAAHWVSYILTTANTWQTPIKDFDMTVQAKNGKLITFCWDGPVEKMENERYRVHKTDFVPAKDLKVYFLSF